jgi:hypothetical protein
MGDRRPRHARRAGSRTGRSRASVGGQEPHTWAASSASTSLATAHSPAQSPPSTRGSRSGTCATRTATRRTSAPPRSAPCLVPQGNLAPMPLPLQLLHSVCHEAARDDDLNASGLQHSFYTKGPATGGSDANANSTTERRLGSRATACHLGGSSCTFRGL